MTSIYKIDSQGRIVTAQSTPSISLTTKTINAELLLNNTQLGSSNAFDVDLSLITDGLTCEHLRIECLLRGSVSALTDVVYMFLNNDTTVTNYYRQRMSAAGATQTNDFANNPLSAVINGNTAEANNFSIVRYYIPDYRDSTREKNVYIEYRQYESTTNGRVGGIAYQWQNTASINRIQIRTDNHPTDLFLTGSEIWIYGEKSLDVVTNATIS